MAVTCESANAVKSLSAYAPLPDPSSTICIESETPEARSNRSSSFHDNATWSASLAASPVTPCCSRSGRYDPLAGG